MHVIRPGALTPGSCIPASIAFTHRTWTSSPQHTELGLALVDFGRWTKTPQYGPLACGRHKPALTVNIQREPFYVEDRWPRRTSPDVRSGADLPFVAGGPTGRQLLRCLATIGCRSRSGDDFELDVGNVHNCRLVLQRHPVSALSRIYEHALSRSKTLAKFRSEFDFPRFRNLSSNRLQTTRSQDFLLGFGPHIFVGHEDTDETSFAGDPGPSQDYLEWERPRRRLLKP